MSPSPFYLLLSSPKGWVGTPQQGVIAHALKTGAWTFDPNEKPENHPPLLEAVIAGFNTPGPTYGDGQHHARLEAFKDVVTALFDAGTRLDEPLAAITFSGFARDWFENVSRAGGAYAKDLSRIERCLEILEKNGGTNLKNFRQWCVEEKVNLATVLAGDSLLAHVAAGACATPLGWKTSQMGMSPGGWLMHGRNGEGAIWNNQASAHQRLTDALLFHRWVEELENPSLKALWWLMAWPLSDKKKVHAGKEKREAFDWAFDDLTQSPGLVSEIEKLLQRCAPPLKPRLAQLVLAAAVDLPSSTAPQRVWTLMSQALHHHPTSHPSLGLEFWWNLSSPGDGHAIGNARFAVNSLIEKWGWPTQDWADSASVPRSDLVQLWAIGLASGQLPSGHDIPAGHWRLWALEDEAIKWPSADQMDKWFAPKGLKNQALQWLENGEKAQAALARKEVLEERLSPVASPRTKVRM